VIQQKGRTTKNIALDGTTSLNYLSWPPTSFTGYSELPNSHLVYLTMNCPLKDLRPSSTLISYWLAHGYYPHCPLFTPVPLLSQPSL
jgi:hypothetical protein